MKTKHLFVPPPGAQAALFFADGQYFFQAIANDSFVSKSVSPAAVKQAFANEPMDSDWLPPNVNRYGVSSRGMWMVRWHAPATYSLNLDTGQRIRKLRVALPALVWFGQRHAYYIWAMKGARFDPQAGLFRAPLPNVNHQGLICFGQNNHPDVAKGGFEKSWSVFWDAAFNNDHVGGKSRTHEQSIIPKLVFLAKTKAAKYPVEDLIPMQTSLDAAIKQMTNRGGRS